MEEADKFHMSVRSINCKDGHILSPNVVMLFSSISYLR